MKPPHYTVTSWGKDKEGAGALTEAQAREKRLTAVYKVRCAALCAPGLGSASIDKRWARIALTLRIAAPRAVGASAAGAGADSECRVRLESGRGAEQQSGAAGSCARARLSRASRPRAAAASASIPCVRRA